MSGDSIADVTEAQAKLNKLIDQESFAISRHGVIVGVYLSKDRIEALIESVDLLSNSEFAKALKGYESGRMKSYDATELDKTMSA